MRGVRRWVGVVGVMVLPACYRAVPIDASTPPVGETVSFVISDRGRVGLGDRLGPGVARVEGRVVEAGGEEFVVNVFRVASLNGETSAWSGETVRLNREYVERLQGRQLNKRRTALVAAGVTAVVVYFIATRGLGGLFSGDDEPGEGNGGVDQKRARSGIRH